MVWDYTYRKVFTKKALVVSVWVVNLGIGLFAKCEIVNVTSLSHTPIVKDCFFIDKICLEQNATFMNSKKRKDNDSFCGLRSYLQKSVY